MYEDFKKLREESNIDYLKDLKWQATIKDADKFSVDLVYDTKHHVSALIHVGKNGYVNDEFYTQDIDINTALENEIDDTAEFMKARIEHCIG